MILRAFLTGFPLAGLLLMGVSDAAAALRADAPKTQSRTVGIKLLDDGLVLVPMLVNGSGPHLFVLDTGGASTIVSDTLAGLLGLVQEGIQRIDTMSGSRTVGRARVDELRLGTETFTAIDVLRMDLASLQASDARIQGVVGQNVLRTRNYLIDYENRRLTFDPPEPTGGPRLPLDWSDGRPVVQATAHHAVRGESRGANRGASRTSVALRFVIDSGGTHVILFDNVDAAEPLVHALRRGASTTMTMTTHAGSRPVMTATVDRLELTGGTALRDVVAALVPSDPGQGRIEDGLLPASLFRAIYFDNRAGEVVFKGR